MSNVAVVLSTGFEEIEAVTIIDVLRRANINVVIATINEILTVGANGIAIQANQYLHQLDSKDFDMVVLPGGAQNTQNLATSSTVKEFLYTMKKEDKYIAAICAAPYALHEANVLNQTYTCYPSFEKKIDSATYISDEKVVIDGKVVTSQGPATAMVFALELVKIMQGESLYTQIKNGLLL